MLPHPARDANKYTRGTVLVVGGSADYPGAPVLAAQAAARAGAGYVRLAVPQGVAPAARAHLLSIPVTPCTQVAGTFDLIAAREVRDAGAKSGAFVIGPGLTTRAGAVEFLSHVLLGLEKPVVLDADALNIVAAHPELLDGCDGLATVITPHEGEAARLLGHAVGNRQDAARELAERYGCTVVLKGPRTLVADRSGLCLACPAGGPELAKAGTGDVLAGMVGAFVAQGLEALEAAALAVYLHGRAGALAARRSSVLSVMPEDVVDFIGPAVGELAGLAE